MSDPLQVSAADLCELPAMQIEKRPLSDGPTTEITTGILVADITAIDDVSQTITGDFIVMSRWVDPRLEVLNSSQLSSKRMHQKDQVEVEAGGRVSYYQKLYGSIATYHNLARFPFDPQRFRLRATSLEYDKKDILYWAATLSGWGVR